MDFTFRHNGGLFSKITLASTGVFSFVSDSSPFSHQYDLYRYKTDGNDLPGKKQAGTHLYI